MINRILNIKGIFTHTTDDDYPTAIIISSFLSFTLLFAAYFFHILYPQFNLSKPVEQFDLVVIDGFMALAFSLGLTLLALSGYLIFSFALWLILSYGLRLKVPFRKVYSLHTLHFYIVGCFAVIATLLLTFTGFTTLTLYWRIVLPLSVLIFGYFVFLNLRRLVGGTYDIRKFLIAVLGHGVGMFVIAIFLLTSSKAVFTSVILKYENVENMTIRDVADVQNSMKKIEVTDPLATRIKESAVKIQAEQ